jgi:hypothetical protein
MKSRIAIRVAGAVTVISALVLLSGPVGQARAAETAPAPSATVSASPTGCANTPWG